MYFPLNFLSAILLLQLLLLKVSPGSITKLSFELFHPHPLFATVYLFTLKLDTSAPKSTYFRITFPYQLHTTSISEITASLYVMNPDPSCSQTSLIGTIQAEMPLNSNPYAYYFAFAIALSNTSFYQIKVQLTTAPSMTINNPYVPVEIDTVTMLDPDAMIIDTNPGFADIVLNTNPNQTLTTSYSVTSFLPVPSMVRSINAITFSVTLTQKIDIGSMYKISFNTTVDTGYTFISGCSCSSPTPSNNLCLSYGCSLSTDYRELIFFMNQTLEGSTAFEIMASVINPAVVTIGAPDVTFLILVYQPISNLIFEYNYISASTSSESINTMAFQLIPTNSPKIYVNYGVDITSTSTNSWVMYAFKRESSTSNYTAYNSLQLTFEVNTPTPDTINVVVKIDLSPYTAANTIILTGSITHNFQQNINNTNIVPKIANGTNAGIEIHNVGPLTTGTTYYISFKIFFNENTPTTTTSGISIVLCSKNDSGALNNFSTQAIFPPLTIQNNTEYNDNTTYLVNTGYHYVVSSPGSSNSPITTQMTAASPIGVFSSASNQTLLFYIVPNLTDWCSNGSFCSLTDTSTNMFMYVDFSKKIDVSSALFVLDNITDVNDQSFDTTNTNYNQAYLRCVNAGVCMDLIFTQKVDNNALKGFAFSPITLNFQNSPYPDDYLADFIFTLGYNQNGAPSTEAPDIIQSGFLYNSYVISNTYDSNLTLSLVNYIVYNNHVGNDGSIFPTMVHLSLTMDTTIISLNPKYFSFFFDSSLENYSFRDYPLNSSDSNYYTIGCNGTSKFQPFNCTTWDSNPFRNSNPDSWVQMGRVDIRLKTGVTLVTGDDIEVYIPFSIYGNNSFGPQYFSLGIWNTSEQFVGVFRLTGSKLNVDLPTFDLPAALSDPLNVNNYNSISTLNCNYRFADTNQVYSNNLVNLTALSEHSDNSYQLLINEGTNIGAGFTISSSYDIFFNSQASFVATISQCISLAYTKNIKNYAVYCPYENNSLYSGNQTGVGVVLNSVKIPLDWFKNFSLAPCTLAFTWSNNNGALFSGMCGNFTVATANSKLAIFPVVLPGTYIDDMTVNVTTDTKFTCLSLDCFIQINLIFITSISTTATTNATCVIFDNYNKSYSCSYNVSTTNNQITVNNISSVTNYSTYELGESFTINLLNFCFFNNWSVAFTSSIFYQSQVNPVYENDTAISLNNNVYNATSPFLNVSNMIFSMSSKNAMSTFILTINYNRTIFHTYSLSLNFSNFFAISSEYTQCQVFFGTNGTSFGAVPEFIGTLILDVASLLITFRDNYFTRPIALIIKCYGFKNPTSDSATITLSMLKNQIAALETLSKSASSLLTAEVDINSTSNVTKFYDCIYLPPIYQLNIIPSTITSLQVNSSIFIMLLRKTFVKFNPNGQIICKINNNTMPCSVNADQFLQIPIIQTVPLPQNKIFQIELHNIRKLQLVSGVTESSIFFGYSSTGFSFDELGYIIEDYSIDARSYSFINIIGLNAENTSIGALTTITIYLYLNATILMANQLLMVFFPFQYDFNYSTPTNFSCYLYDTEASAPINLITYWYFNVKYLIIGVNNINIASQKYTIILDNITLPWKSDTYSPCFEDQFVVFSVKNYTTSSNFDMLTSLDYMNFQTINYTYCDPSCKTCSNTSNTGCTSCLSPLFLDNSQCLGACPTGWTEDDKNQVCRICNNTCLKCYGNTASDCATCPSTRTLQLVSSDSGYCECNTGLNDFGNTDCEACAGSCATCSGIKINNCLSCYSSMSVINGSCVCPNGMFNDTNSTCASCDIRCKSCNPQNISNCLSCYTNHTIINGYCVCPANYSDINYREENCSTILYNGCDYTCESCISPSNSDCVTCGTTRTLNNGTCPCQSGYYDSNAQQQCEKCYRTCQTCSGLLDNDCSTCFENRVMTGSNTCICPTGMSDINRMDNCSTILTQNCDPSCSTCIGPTADECVACIANRTLTNDLCSCNTNYYPVNGSNLCLACNFRCQTCGGPLDSDCTTCSNNHSVVLTNGNSMQCGCPSGSSDLDYLSICLPLISNSLCHPSCGSCVGTNNSQCASCNSSTRSFNLGYCSCKGSLFETNQYNCSDCHYSCYNCTGDEPNECLYCLSNRGTPSHLPMNGICQCPSGYTDVLVATCEYNQDVNNLETATTAAIAIISATFLPLFVVGLFGIIWKFIDVAQLLSYMIFINIDFPLNFNDFLSLLYNFNLNNLIPNPFKKLFNTNSDTSYKSTNIYNQMPPLRFELQNKSSSFLFNAATLMLIQLAIWSFLGLLFKINKNFVFKYSESCQKLQNFLQWSLFLQIIQSAELEFYLYIALQIMNPSFATIFNAFSFLMMLFFFCYCLHILKEIYKKLNQKAHYDHRQEINEEFNIKFSYLWELNKTECFLTRTNPIFSSFRKIFICFSLAFGHWLPSLQIGLVFTAYLIMWIYFLMARPFKEMRNNVISIITEFGLLLMHLLFLIYYINDFSNQTKLQLGWVFIGILGVIMFINMVGLLIEVVINIRQLIKRLMLLKTDCLIFFQKNPKKLENYKEVDLSPMKVEDKNKDLSDMRGLKEGNFMENDENLSEKTSVRRKDEVSPLDVNMNIESDEPGKFDHNKYSLKVGENEDLAMNKTSMDEIKEKEFVRKIEKNPTYRKPPETKNVKEGNDLDINKLSIFLNKKMDDRGFGAAKLQHVESEQLKIMTEGQRVANAKGQRSFQEKENEIQRRGFGTDFDKNQSPTKNEDLNEEKGNKYEKNWKNEGFSLGKMKEDSYIGGRKNNLEEKNYKNYGFGKDMQEKSRDSQHFQTQEKSLPEAENPNLNESVKTKSQEKFKFSEKPLEKQQSMELKKEQFSGKSIEKQHSMELQDQKKGKTITKKPSDSLFHDLNKINEETKKSEIKDKNKQSLMPESSKTKSNLTYSKSSFGLNANKSPFNHEILSLIEEKPLEENKKKNTENIENKPKIHKYPVQDELVFESAEDIVKRKEKNRGKPESPNQNFDYTKGFNFFLTEKSSSKSEKNTGEAFKKVNAYGICVKETWSKGLDFFFLTQGEKVKVLESNGAYLKCEWNNKVGLFEDCDVMMERK